MSETGPPLSGTTRPIRVDTHRVRLDRSDGVLINLSSTGALVRVPVRFAVGSEVRLQISADASALHVPCRVVRCTDIPITIPGGSWKHHEFDVAVAFDRHAEELRKLLDLFQHPDTARR